jgi:hypothetical protein
MSSDKQVPTNRVIGVVVLVALVGFGVWVLDSRDLVWTKTYCTRCGTVKEVRSERWLGGAREEAETNYHYGLGMDFPHQHDWVEPPIEVMNEPTSRDAEAIRDAIVREKVERLSPGSDLPEMQKHIDGFSLERQRKVWEFALDPERPFAWSALRIFQQDARKETRWQRWEDFIEQYRCEGETEIRCFLEPSGTTLRVVTPDKQTYKPIDWSTWR